jgi:3-dehydroshikimate dehydratase
MQPGLLSITFRKLPAADIVGLAAEAGLAAIEWGGDIHVPHGDVATASAVRRMCDDHGLTVSTYGSYYRAGGTPDQNPGWSSVVATAIALGTGTVRVWAGTRGSADAAPADRQAVVDDLARCCDAAATHGLVVATEFHGGTLTDDVGSAVELLGAVGRPNLRTLWQPPVGMDPTPALAGLNRVAPWLSNVHVFHWWPDARDRRPLAEGEAHWAAYLPAAAAAGSAYASLEFVAGDDVDQFRRDAATLRRWLSDLPAT